MPCRVPKKRFSCGAPQNLTKNQNLFSPRPKGGLGRALLSVLNADFITLHHRVPLQIRNYNEKDMPLCSMSFKILWQEY